MKDNYSQLTAGIQVGASQLILSDVPSRLRSGTPSSTSYPFIRHAPAQLFVHNLLFLSVLTICSLLLANCFSSIFS